MSHAQGYLCDWLESGFASPGRTQASSTATLLLSCDLVVVTPDKQQHKAALASSIAAAGWVGLQAQDLAQAANPDPWQVAEYEANLAAGERGVGPPEGVPLLMELEIIVEAESHGSTAGSEDQSHMQQCVSACLAGTAY